MIWWWIPLWLGGVTATGCLEVRGNDLLASDLAGAIPAFRAAEPNTRLGAAPFPGVRHTLAVSDLERLLRLAQVGPPESLTPICIERYRLPLTREALLVAMNAVWEGEEPIIELEDYDHAPFPEGVLEFRRKMLPAAKTAGGTVIWRGHVRFEAHRTAPVWAKVRVSIKRRVILASRQLERGQPVGSGAIEEWREMPPASTDSAMTLSQVRTMAARRRIAAGTILSPTLLVRSPDVRAGETVVLRCCHGAACVALEATAISGGIVGQTIRVRGPFGKLPVTARITGPGHVQADARGR